MGLFELKIGEIISILTPPILRSVAGWAENSLEDGRIQKYEIKKLVQTTVRVSMVALSIHYGLNGAGVHIDALASGFSALVADKLFSSVEKGGKRK